MNALYHLNCKTATYLSEYKCSKCGLSMPGVLLYPVTYGDRDSSVGWERVNICLFNSKGENIAIS